MTVSFSLFAIAQIRTWGARLLLSKQSTHPKVGPHAPFHVKLQYLHSVLLLWMELRYLTITHPTTHAMG